MAEEPKLFRQVDEHVVRSSMPKTEGHLEFLKSHGVGGIISIEPMSTELEVRARKAGMKVISLPLDADGRPTEKELRKAFRFVRANAGKGRKTLFHCSEGRQRTSVLALNYAVSKSMDPLQAWIRHDYGAPQEHKEWIAQDCHKLRKLMGAQPHRHRK
jgi:protein-tyrosine phosphatase